jgi:uncharacterized lipoprotein YajG
VAIKPNVTQAAMVATISEFSIMNAAQRWSTSVAFHVAEIRLTVLIPMSDITSVLIEVWDQVRMDTRPS